MTLKERKVYPATAILLGTVLGGPLVTGFILFKNYRTLGLPAKGIYTWIIAIIATIVIVRAIIFVPESDFRKLPILLVVNGAIAYTLMKILQQKQVNSYLSNGGESYDWSAGAIAGIIGGILSIGLFFIAILTAYALHGGVC